MNAKITRISAGIFFAAVAAAANADYRCDAPPSWVDRDACAAADQGPVALRRFVEQMNSLRINIQFADYVNESTAQKWDSTRRQAQLQENKQGDKQEVAAVQSK